MKRRLVLALGASALLSATMLPGAAFAMAPASPIPSTHEATVAASSPAAALDLAGPVTVYVELAGEPVAVAQGRALDASPSRRLTTAQRDRLRAALAARQQTVATRIERLGGKVVARYRDAVNALKVTIARDRLAALGGLPGVVRVQAVPRHAMANANTDGFIGADKAWGTGQAAGSTGYTGAGVRIAVIDSGVDYYHADFGGAGDPADYACDDGRDATRGARPCAKGSGASTFPTVKVIGGYDFVGDCYDAGADPNAPRPATNRCPHGVTDVPDPDADPLDCNGHGSHVAGTAAGFGVVRGGKSGADQRYRGQYTAATLSSTDWLVAPGVAPRARILAYRVFGCEGTTSLVLDAIDRAVQDDADVISLALGSPFGRGDSIDAEAADNASLAGAVVVAAAGNDGPSGYITASPGTATRAISVAAVDAVPSVPTAVIDLGRGTDVPAIDANGTDLARPTQAVLRIFRDDPTTTASTVRAGVEPDESLGCDGAAYAFNAVKAKYARGDIAVVRRGACARVQKALQGQDHGAAAVVMINSDGLLPPFEGAIQGTAIPFLGVASGAAETLAANDGVPVAIRKGALAPNPGYRLLAGSSSGGPRNGDSALKPDVAAPGVSVSSALAGGGTRATTISGTSAAAAAVAGTAALVREAHPTWRPVRVKAAITGTAVPGAVASGGQDVRLAGAGVVQARRALDTKSVLTTDSGSSSLDFGYQELTAGTSLSRTATLWNLGATPVNYRLTATFDRAPLGFGATVTPPSVTIPGGGRQTVRLTLTVTDASVAALPDAQAPSGPYMPVLAVRGSLVATPNSGGSGMDPVRSPFLLVPRGISAIAPADITDDPQGNVATSTVDLVNGGVHAGSADIFAWGLGDARDSGGSADLRAVGTQTFACAALFGGHACRDGGPTNDRIVVFGIATWGRWSNQVSDVYSVLIDTAPCAAAAPGEGSRVPCLDSDPEYRLVAGDRGLLRSGIADGVMTSWLFKADGTSLSEEFPVAEVPNGSTLEVAVAASDLGLGSADGSVAGRASRLRYTVQSSSQQPGTPSDVIDDASGTGAAWASLDPWQPAVCATATTDSTGADGTGATGAAGGTDTTGGAGPTPATTVGACGDGTGYPNVSLAPGASATLTLRADRQNAAGDPAKGWMIVSLDDASGEPQVDLVPIDSGAALP